MCIFTGNFDFNIFSRSYVLFELRNFARMKDTTKTVCQLNSSETAQQNLLKLSSNEGHRCVDVHIHKKFLFNFFSRSCALFEHRNLAKMKDTTETVCQRKSSEAARQTFLKLCSCDGHTNVPRRCVYP